MCTCTTFSFLQDHQRRSWAWKVLTMSKSSVDLSSGKGHFDTKTVSDRVRNFSNCGRSAQLMLLENGCWTRLNRWTEFAIASKDAPLIKEILNAVQSMPTSWSQLNANRKGLPITVQQLLQRLVSGNKEFGDDSESVKLLCAEVFAKWFRTKKNLAEETDNQRIYILDEQAEVKKGVIALIKNKPGYGFLAVNGSVFLIQLKPYQPPSTCSPIPPATVSSSTDQEKSINDKKCSLPFDSPKVQVVQEQVHFPISTQSGSEVVQVDNHLDSSCSSSIDVGVEYTTPFTSTPTKCGVAPMFGMHDMSPEEIGSSNNKMHNESVLSEAVSNGQNQSLENYCKSESTAKRRLNMAMVPSDDEYDDNDNRLVIDEEDQRNESINVDDLDETLEIPRFKETQSSPENLKAASPLPWKRYKILFSRDTVFPVVNSDEEQIQKVRESMVVKVKLEPGSYLPDHPVEIDNDELMGNDGDDVANSTFILMSTGDDVVDGESRVQNTGASGVFDYDTEQSSCHKSW